ncbi:MAG: alpha/beta hydrolase [Pseudomonadota bacterium]
MFGDRFTLSTVDTPDCSLSVRHGGEGPPVLLLHGYPQTHAMWHAVAPTLAERFHVICPDLRGYGESAKPPTDADHTPYSKRAMAADMVALMAHFGHETFAVAGHDRGARVTHRLALDHPERVSRACVMDITPTLHMFETTDQHFASGYYHWFFLIQPDGLPETLIGRDPGWYLSEKLRRAAAPGYTHDRDAMAHYQACFANPDTVHASCEDYRAAASIDLVHDRASRDAGERVRCPLLVLWGEHGFVHRSYDVPAVWADYADDITCESLNTGHYVPEEDPAGTLRALGEFLDS